VCLCVTDTMINSLSTTSITTATATEVCCVCTKRCVVCARESVCRSAYMCIHVCVRTFLRVNAYVCIHSTDIFMYACVRVDIFTHTHKRTSTGGVDGGMEKAFNPRDGIVQHCNLGAGKSTLVLTTSGVCTVCVCTRA